MDFNSHWLENKGLDLLKLFTAACLILSSSLALALSIDRDPANERDPASIARGVQALATPSRLLYNGETLISADLIENYQRVQSERVHLSATDFIPLSLKPSDNSNYVMAAIADRTISTMLNRPEIRESTFGRAATKVEKNLKQEVVIGKSATNGIEHKLKFEVQAFQTQAQIRYEGLANAAVSYQARNSTVAFEVFEKLPRSSKLVLSHELRPDQRVSNVSLRWDW